MFKGFCHSVMGASHEKRGIVCQDSSAYKVGEGFAIAVVADGHGSKKHFRSNIGSKCAAEAAVETVERFFADPDLFDESIKKDYRRVCRMIEKQTLMLWNEKVLAHLEANPVTMDEKHLFDHETFMEIPPESYYGTTLVCAVAGRDYSFGFQIGDGSMVAVFENGDTEQIIDYEESNPANITASMCNAMASTMFDEFFVEDRRLLCFFVSTDGLYTSFGSDRDFLDFHTIIAGQLPNIDTFMPSLKNNLVKRSHFGTEDDISLSCVYDAELAVSGLDTIKAKIIANKREAAERKAKLLGKQ